MAAKIANEEVDTLYQKLHRAAEKFGYHLNSDMEFTRDLLKGLLVNKNRYGYMACPCRLASGNRTEDKDIICPCDYRDPDLNEYGNCYCALYVSEDIANGKKEAISIPERRPQKDMQEQEKPPSHVSSSTTSKLTYPVWRCKVCGYLCARGEPPERCPVCRADKDRFEQFM